MKNLALIVLFVLTTACASARPEPAPANMPNPASAYCEEQGYVHEIRSAEDGSQSGACVFPDGSECDEWAFYRNECGPAGQDIPSSAPAEIPTAMPIDQADYQGWWTYTHAGYGFTIMLPEDWVVEETTSADPLMNEHTLMLQPRLPLDVDTSIRMTFRRVGEDTPLWPTGVGSGSFAPQGTLEVAGQAVQRVLFVCLGGQVNSIWYHGANEGETNIRIGELEFGFIFSYTGAYCQEGYSLGGKVQHMGEMIIASLVISH